MLTNVVDAFFEPTDLSFTTSDHIPFRLGNINFIFNDAIEESRGCI
jgi:hypothetical protein